MIGIKPESFIHRKIHSVNFARVFADIGNWFKKKYDEQIKDSIALINRVIKEVVLTCRANVGSIKMKFKSQLTKGKRIKRA